LTEAEGIEKKIHLKRGREGLLLNPSGFQKAPKTIRGKVGMDDEVVSSAVEP
jgi:hypothetical protein